MKQTTNVVSKFGYDILYLDTVDSTNEYLKRNADKLNKNTVVVARTQTNGKGRLGRHFQSDDGGLYMSVFLKPHLSPQQSLFITPAAAVAVAKAVENVCKKQTEIKWVNDVYINSKKVSGILAESKIDSNGNALEYVVLGIGINLFQQNFGKEIEDIAANVFDAPPAEKQRDEIIKQILDNLSAYLDGESFMDEYRSRSNVIGKEILVIKPTESFLAKALEIDDDASLVVQTKDGRVEKLCYGEISVRL